MKHNTYNLCYLHKDFHILVWNGTTDKEAKVLDMCVGVNECYFLCFTAPAAGEVVDQH